VGHEEEWLWSKWEGGGEGIEVTKGRNEGGGGWGKGEEGGGGARGRCSERGKSWKGVRKEGERESGGERE